MSCWSKEICLLIFLMFFWETSQYPFCLCLEEVTLFVGLDGEHPSFGYIIPRFDLPQINKIKNFIVNLGVVLQAFYLNKLFVLSFYFLSWGSLSCTGSPCRPHSCCSAAGGHRPFQHVSISTINSIWNINYEITDVVGHLIEVQWSVIVLHTAE